MFVHPADVQQSLDIDPSVTEVIEVVEKRRIAELERERDELRVEVERLKRHAGNLPDAIDAMRERDELRAALDGRTGIMASARKREDELRSLVRDAVSGCDWAEWRERARKAFGEERAPSGGVVPPEKERLAENCPSPQGQRRASTKAPSDEFIGEPPVCRVDINSDETPIGDFPEDEAKAYETSLFAKDDICDMPMKLARWAWARAKDGK